MIKVSIPRKYLFLIAVLSVFIALPACTDDVEEGVPPTQPAITIEEPVVITIGNLTDITGPGAANVAIVDMALEDMAEYYNQNVLIPGVKLNIIEFDEQLDPANDIPGYEWLMGRGADLIFTPVPGVPTILKPRVDRDQTVMFAVAAGREGIMPPGYVFNVGVDPQNEAYTLLKWIAENHWDYRVKGPAKVGGAGWSEPYSETFLASMENYCSAHPDQFKFEEAYLTNFNFNWKTQIEGLKDCDYVYPGVVMTQFVKQFREAGHIEARFVGSDTSAAFLGTVNWDDIDGMLFIKNPRWWNEECEMINLARQLLDENHPDEAEEIIRSGNAYLAVNQLYVIFSVIANASEAAGPQNLDSQALYDAATSYVLMRDGVQRASFSKEKRNASDTYAIYEARSDQEDLFRLHEEWLPAVRTP